MNETKSFFEKRLKGKKYCFAICRKKDDYPIGYIHAEEDDSHDFVYSLRTARKPSIMSIWNFDDNLCAASLFRVA